MKHGVSFTTRDELRGTGAFGLPIRFLARARMRVRIVALLGMGGFAAFLAYGLARNSMDPGFVDRNRFNFAGDLFAFLISSALYVVSKIEKVGEKTYLNLALVSSVLVCADISLVAPWYYSINSGTLPHVTWVPAIIILVPLLLPIPPRRTLFASVASALTVPAGLAVLHRLGISHPTFQSYLLLSISPAIAVVAASVASTEIYGINRKLAAAQRVAGYTLEKKIGEGGMGVVWLATHRLLARPAAIKLIRPERLHGLDRNQRDIVIGRFQREARATAAMQSPHTVKLYDFGVSDEGSLYYAMEYLDGMDLDTLIDRAGLLPPARAVHLLRQACDSLAEAHAHDLIHRDVKPSNIFVCRFARELDFIKVLDFGIAKAVTAKFGEMNLTRFGRVLGSANYVAPEQVTGSTSEGVQSDIYSLGCVAYWLLTGELVFEGATSEETMSYHARTDPVPPSRRAPAAAVPPRLEELVMSCLEKDPVRRPRSMDAFERALAAIAQEYPWTQADAAASWEKL